MMKLLFIVCGLTAMLLTLPVQAKSYYAISGVIVQLEKWNGDNPTWGDENRSLSYVPIAAYDNQAVYLYAYEVMQDVTITITDSKGNEVASAVVTVFPEQPAVLALGAGRGSYRLDVEYKGDCYYGYFEM